MTKNENLLVTLMEECAELQQAVSKALRFGMDGCRPVNTERNNERDIMFEYYQLVSVMEMLISGNVLHEFSVADEALVKIQKKINVARYQEISESAGTYKRLAMKGVLR